MAKKSKMTPKQGYKRSKVKSVIKRPVAGTASSTKKASGKGRNSKL